MTELADLGRIRGAASRHGSGRIEENGVPSNAFGVLMELADKDSRPRVDKDRN